MRIHELKSIKKRVQRIGRSGKRGSYSGRGVKGQKSRSGRRLRPAERDMIMRIPKQRGFRNKPKREVGEVISVGDISIKMRSFVDGKKPVAITIESLKTARLIGKNFKGAVKLLGDGEMAFPILVTGIKVSASAKAKIEKAGGSIVATK
jgi:large subunit ribosomal protein L15